LEHETTSGVDKGNFTAIPAAIETSVLVIAPLAAANLAIESAVEIEEAITSTRQKITSKPLHLLVSQ